LIQKLEVMLEGRRKIAGIKRSVIAVFEAPVRSMLLTSSRVMGQCQLNSASPG